METRRRRSTTACCPNGPVSEAFFVARVLPVEVRAARIQRSAIHALQELACGEDGDPSEGAQFSEVPVARHEVLGTAGHRTLEELVIVGISPNHRQTPPDTDGVHEGEQLFFDQ
jgi:hypothetical protein